MPGEGIEGFVVVAIAVVDRIGESFLLGHGQTPLDSGGLDIEQGARRNLGLDTAEIVRFEHFGDSVFFTAHPGATAFGSERAGDAVGGRSVICIFDRIGLDLGDAFEVGVFASSRQGVDFFLG